MAEQFVGQEMALSHKEDLYYWSRREKSSSAEVDYVVVIDGRIHSVEVKKRSFRPVEKSASLPGKV